MAQPSTAIVRWDLALNYNQFDLLANRKGFVALKIMPIIMVALQNSNFLKVKIASLLEKIEDTRRAPNGEYKPSDFEFDTDTYATEDHGVTEPLDDRQIKIYASLINAEMIHRNRAINRMLMAFENEVIAYVQNTANFSHAGVNTSWATHSSAQPVDDVMAAIEAVETACGSTPRSMTLGRKTMRNLKQCTQVIERVKYAGFTDPTLPDSEALKALCELFEMDRINIANGFKNTVQKGAGTAVLGRMWDPNITLIHHSTDAGQDLNAPEPRIGNTLCWSEEAAGMDGEEMAVIVEEYRTEKTRGSEIRARGDYVVKSLHNEAGYQLTGCVA